MHPRRAPALAVLLAAAIALPLAAQTAMPSLADLSLEDLVNVEVTSVGKKEMSLFRSPAAIAVVTGDDVRRRGITSLPEALRYVPGMQVAQIDAHTWAVASRGFNLQHANKLLVLQDGRSLYTPSFGGVTWSIQDVVMEDLDRIEVIRGPGATLWGSNAVNGVINISTRSAQETQGTVVSTTLDTEHRRSVTVRHGGAMSPQLYYRIYGKFSDAESSRSTTGADMHDDRDVTRGGFRADWTPSAADHVTFQGDVYAVNSTSLANEVLLAPPFAETVVLRNEARGGNLLGRWSHAFSSGSRLSLQAYYDHLRDVEERRDTVDVQLEHRFSPAPAHDLVWGLEYRNSADEFVQEVKNFFYTPVSRQLDLFTGFAQDEITLRPDRLQVTVGTKVEYYDLTGWEIQPALRLLWTPSDTQAVWASLAHAISLPTRFYHDARRNLSAFQPPGSPVIEVAFLSNPNLESETVDALELGYRLQPHDGLSLDVATFYNVYDKIFGPVQGAPFLETDPAPPHLVVPLRFGNVQQGDSRGAEISVQWTAAESWRLVATYSWLQVNLQPDDTLARSSPKHQVSIRSYVSLPLHLEFNSTLAFTDTLDSLNNTGTTTTIPSFVRVDCGLVWRRSESLEAGLWVENLSDAGHVEFSSQNNALLGVVPRKLTGRLTLRF